jgi:hypothetical protein
MTMSPSSKAEKSQTSTAQTVLPMQAQQKLAGRQLQEVALVVQAASGVAGIVAVVADPVVAAAAVETVDLNKRWNSSN